MKNVAKAFRIGEALPDGWIVGGVSPDTGEVISLEPELNAVKGLVRWEDGRDHAGRLRAQGHAGARMPSEGELSAIYNGIVKGGQNSEALLNKRGKHPFGRYWSGTIHAKDRDLAYVQYMNDGWQTTWLTKYPFARVRCVRDEPGVVLG